MFSCFLDDITKKGLNVHAIEVFKDEQVIFRHAFDEDRRYPVYSATKSFTSAVFSIATDEGKISADCPLCEFMEKRYLKQMSDEIKRMPLSAFLSMTAGSYPFRPQGSNWLEYIFSLHMDAARDFHYSNIPAYLVGVACENAVGMPLFQYMREKLLLPLGIKSNIYRTSPEGYFYGATGMELTVHELSLLGQLYLQKGSFQGQQLISSERIEDSVSIKVKTDDVGYGYFFYITRDGFSINGKWGQRCLVYPEKSLMITYVSELPNRADEMLALAQQLANKL